MAMNVLGLGLSASSHNKDALSVRGAELSTLRRVGASEERILVVQGNLASTYVELGRLEEALPLMREVYSGRLKLLGEDNRDTLLAANNCAGSLNRLRRHTEATVLLRKIIPVARRVFGECDTTTLRLRWNYVQSLYLDPAASLDDLREAMTILEEIHRTARRVLGGAHPLTEGMELDLRDARPALRAREATSK